MHMVPFRCLVETPLRVFKAEKVLSGHECQGKKTKLSVLFYTPAIRICPVKPLKINFIRYERPAFSPQMKKDSLLW